MIIFLAVSIINGFQLIDICLFLVEWEDRLWADSFKFIVFGLLGGIIFPHYGFLDHESLLTECSLIADGILLGDPVAILKFRMLGLWGGEWASECELKIFCIF